MSGKVRAAVLSEVGAPFVVEEIDLDAPGPHDVRVALAASGFCHSDFSVAKGSLPYMFPTVLGHEGAGVVVEVGERVTRVAPGDHVVLAWMAPCRECYWCLKGDVALCERAVALSFSGAYASLRGQKLVRGLGVGAFGEQTIVPEKMAVRIDPSVPLDVAALVGCALSTGVGAVWHTAGVEPGSSVAVVGCGGVGLSVVQGARLAGATTIVAIDAVASKLEMARSSGATATVLVGDVDDDAARQRVVSGVEGVAAAVREHTGGRGADYAFEVVGRSQTIRTAFASARRGGTVVMVGAGSPDDRVDFSAFELFLDAKTLKGCVYGSTDPERDFPLLAGLVQRGEIDAGVLISRRIALDEINEAVDAMESAESARSLIVYDVGKPRTGTR